MKPMENGGTRNVLHLVLKYSFSFLDWINMTCQKEVMLNQLELGVMGMIVVMICRMWDLNYATGRYLSTDFIVFDQKVYSTLSDCPYTLPDVMFGSNANQLQLHGNLMHCTARGNVTHNFLRLKEGAIYSVKNFIVQPKKDDFRVLRFAHFMLEFDGDTVVGKSSVSSDGFDHADGYVTNIGRTTHQKSGSKTLDFHLANNRLYLSSTSSTLIVDDEQIFVLKRLKTDDSGVELTKEMLLTDNTAAKAGTLENLLMWARNWKYDSLTFHCVVKIDKVKTKKGWNYPSCSGEKCKKGNLDCKDGRFWCDSCNTSVDYPSDKTGHCVLVLRSGVAFWLCVLLIEDSFAF
nr:hypothetical protein [Tanacetum cinerariifolium]